MSTRFSVERIERNPGDTILFGIMILLVGLGLSMLFSSSYYFSERMFDNPAFMLVHQLKWAALGAVTACILFYIPLEYLRKYSALLFLCSFILTMLSFIPGIGKEIMGARRWIFLFGNSFQPSELFKLTSILYLSHLVSKKEEGDINNLPNSLAPLLIAILSFVVPVYLQNDYSTAFFLFLIAVIFLFLARVRLYYFISGLLVTTPIALLLLFVKEYRVRRIIAFLAPEMDPSGTAYQLLASQSALVRGGFWGAGLGNGIKKLGGLPQAHSDFIFAVIGEEAGFVGVLAVIAIFAIFAIRGLRIARRADSRFHFYLATGITLSIVSQAFLNAAVVCGVIPATGIPLPFFSAGGSSLFISMAMCGILLNVSRNHQVKREAENV